MKFDDVPAVPVTPEQVAYVLGLVEAGFTEIYDYSGDDDKSEQYQRSNEIYRAVTGQLLAIVGAHIMTQVVLTNLKDAMMFRETLDGPAGGLD